VWFVLIGVLVASRCWRRAAPVASLPGPARPSPLDVLEPNQLDDSAWPRDNRPAEAVGVFDRDRDADDRLESSIDKGVILVKNARGEEVVRIDSYAPPTHEDGGVIFNLRPMDFGQARDDHAPLVTALSPKADRLVVLGHTKHTPSHTAMLKGEDASGSCEWAQVWRWEDGALNPLEVQLLESQYARAAAFSPDGKLLATSSAQRTEIWEVGEKELIRLGKLSLGAKQLLFAPDGRSLALMNHGSFDMYDLGPIFPDANGWPRWRLLCVALGLAAAVAIFGFVWKPRPIDSNAPLPRPGSGGTIVDSQTGEAVTCLPPKPGRGAAPNHARAQQWLSIAAKVAFLGVVACVAWWAWQPVPDGAPLNAGLGFGAALTALVLFAWGLRRSPESADKPGSRVANLLCLVAVLGAVVCLGFWAWQFWWPSPSLVTRKDSDLASADIRSACFSADGSELAALCFGGRLSLFDTTTGQEIRGWRMPEGVLRPEYAADGRHLLALAASKAYVLRLKPFDDAAYVLSCCEKVLEQNPKSIDALLARGHVHLHQGELDESIADFTGVIALDEKSAAAYYGRGLARTDKGDYAGARDDFAAALRLDPKLAGAVTRRAPP
jgi:hypothetical protein